jgi:serine/threonine protein kinase
VRDEEALPVTLHEMLEKARASAQKLQPSEAAVLFAAAVRLAAARGATLRARLIEMDEAGALHLLPFDENAPEPTPSYLAPELLAPGAPRKTEPRVQVYAAGALGYELLTGKHAPSGPPGAELGGPLGDIVRIALSADRRERFGDMNQLQDALAGVQPRPPAEGERNILVALRTRFGRRPPEKEAVARLIEKVAALEQ